MSHADVSVIVPVYRGASHLGQAIASVLGQSHGNLELLVVDDASPDDSAAVVKAFDDPRLRYLRHESNRGANAARNTGIRAARAPIVAFLDQDDWFDADKLAAHVAVHHGSPDVGATYGPRFNVDDPPGVVRHVWRPPTTLTLSDLVLGYPMSPSDMVVRRTWLERAGLWDETHDFFGGEIILAGRLVFEGCRFRHVPRVLNYRRYHAGRTYSHLETHCQGEVDAQEKILSDPRCPPDVVAQRPTAFATMFVKWAYIAYVQQDKALGDRFLRDALRHDPSLVAEGGTGIARALVADSVAGIDADHEGILGSIWAQLPRDVSSRMPSLEWAILKGDMIQAARAVVWGRAEQASRHLAHAHGRGERPDEAFEGTVTHELAGYELAHGPDSVPVALGAVADCLGRAGWPGVARRVTARYWVDKAFESARRGDAAGVRRFAARAVVHSPRYLLNRGVLSILGRSAAGLGTRLAATR